MPIRDEPFVTNKIYHIFNKSIEDKRIFEKRIFTNYFLNALYYYRSDKSTLSYSRYLKVIPTTEGKQITLELDKVANRLVEVHAYCLMPNHYHLLIRQKKDYGIIKVMSNTINAFTRYFNLLNNRSGTLFLGNFKAHGVTSHKVYLHVSRYIHLNPYTAGVNKSFTELRNNPFDSYGDYYYNKNNKILTKEYILDYFSKNKKNYSEFVENQADYQKSLHCLKKHLEP
jgi:putative transposase